MIRWGEPLWLFGLFIPVGLFFLEWLLRGSWRGKRSRFASPGLWPQLAPGRSAVLRRTKRILLLAAYTMLVLGLANPRIGTRYEEVTREGIDIFLLVDVSKSMDTRDIRPSRLAKTRYELNRFLEGLKGDRVGVIPFAGTAYTLCPLTLDYSAARMFVDLLSTDLVPTPGTDIASAIESALASFPEEESRNQAMVLVSDGEDHEGRAVVVAKEAGKRGIPIYTIGMALKKGDPIPVFDDQGNPAGWKTDDEGDIVTSRLNEQMLRDIASASGGEYFRAGQGGEAFRAAYRKIFRLDRKELAEKRITGFEDRFQVLLLLALLLLVLEFVLPMGTRPKAGRGLVAGAIFLSLLLLPAIPGMAKNPHRLVKEGNKDVIEGELDSALVKYLEAHSELDTLPPELLYNLGGVYARKKELGKADTLYRSLPTESPDVLKSRAMYNRGTAMAEAERYDEAVKSFIESLRLNPEDVDAKKNLELALRRMQQQEQQQQQDQEDPQDQEEQQQQQQQDQEQQQDDRQQQQADREQQQSGEEQQPQPESPEEMDKKLAERFLDKLQRDEKELLKEVVRNQIPAEKKKAKKDW